jgi:hypothetical protein
LQVPDARVPADNIRQTNAFQVNDGRVIGVCQVRIVQVEESVTVTEPNELVGDNSVDRLADARVRQMVFCQSAHPGVDVVDRTVE